MTEQTKLPLLSRPRPDRWCFGRVAVVAFLAVFFVAADRVVDFYPAGYAWRSRLDGELMLLVLLEVFFLLFLAIWLILAVVALFRRRFRRMASSLVALAMVPVVLLFSSFSIFDPWYWYVVLNKDRLEQMAETMPVAEDGNYKILSDWDMSRGIAGLNTNTFVALTYGKAPDTQKANSMTRSFPVYGNFYLRYTEM